jgi:predicted Zn finger-like uncharacterized protein
MQTECPHCHTVFSIGEEQLNQADGQVRCGHCLAVFTAENPYQNEKYSLHDDLIEDQLTDELFDQAEEETTNIDDIILPDVIPPNLRAETRDTRKHYGFIGNTFWTLAILFMLITGILQYAHYDRVRLVQFSELRPWLGLMCEYTNCDLPDPRDPSRIELNNKNIFSHPNSKNALMVSASIVNQAAFEQAFPLLELKFENIRGQTIAGRRFTPAEYLGVPVAQISKMIPGEPVSISIEIMDPGKEMVSYAFEFL